MSNDKIVFTYTSFSRSVASVSVATTSARFIFSVKFTAEIVVLQRNLELWKGRIAIDTQNCQGGCRYKFAVIKVHHEYCS